MTRWREVVRVVVVVRARVDLPLVNQLRGVISLILDREVGLGIRTSCRLRLSNRDRPGWGKDRPERPCSHNSCSI
jgi:hypothetical protein